MSSELTDWYAGRRVLVTGHTGFKGAWLTAWLRSAGASVTGYSLAPPTAPSLFEAARVGEGIESIRGDVCDHARLRAAVRRSQPELVFHLAAQSLVRPGYRDPVGTYATNVMGTVNVLDAVRDLPAARAVVVVTSDKCYENRELDHPYHEDEPMGGRDPYSSSKGCAELVTAAMRRSFFDDHGAAVASARAGNVIGGGDWATDRLVPDLIRSAAAGAETLLRSPSAVRPWQHVLEPVRGYLMLGRALVERGSTAAEAWNFGPGDEDCVTVAEVVRRMRSGWERVAARPADDRPELHEAGLLKLDCSKARARLGWTPLLGLDDAVSWTVDWYRRYYESPATAGALVAEQLARYESRGMGEAAS